MFVGDKSRTFNTDLLQTLEMRNILDIAEAITLGALARNEFRGAHWRKEYQERRDEEWLKHTMLSWNDGRRSCGTSPSSSKATKRPTNRRSGRTDDLTVGCSIPSANSGRADEDERALGRRRCGFVRSASGESLTASPASRTRFPVNLDDGCPLDEDVHLLMASSA